ncbi:MAG: hypothetical protein EXR60_05740 [Dehalococcoidia bacterium]|nr:hypothetical protein [Dehalococcoidia bacterium]
MHDLMVHECQHCINFRYTFSEDGELAEWGYCSLERKDKLTPSEEEARGIEEEAKQGDRRRLLDGRFGLYRLEADDGCDLFSPRDEEEDHDEDEDHASEDQMPYVGRGGV